LRRTNNTSGCRVIDKAPEFNGLSPPARLSVCSYALRIHADLVGAKIHLGVTKALFCRRMLVRVAANPSSAQIFA
jgi:hypothetical protein